MEDLFCFNNRLTSLDISNNTALKGLSCEGNQLTSLDVSKNTDLMGLMCAGNPLEVLNLGEVNLGLSNLDYGGLVSSTKLKVIGTEITDLNVLKNKLQSLDVSECPALRDLDCSSNQLTTLNVIGCSALTFLDCHDNELTSLDVSKTNIGNSTELYPLNCSSMFTRPVYDCSLKTLYLKTGWKIKGITVERSTDYIPDETEIRYKD